MATKKTETKEKKATTKKKTTAKKTTTTKKTATKKTPKKIEEPVEEIKKEALNNLDDFKKVKPYTKAEVVEKDPPIEQEIVEEIFSNKDVEVMNGDPSVVVPIEEPNKEEVVPVEEPRTEPKKKIMRRINRAIGYFWNGQMIDF